MKKIVYFLILLAVIYVGFGIFNLRAPIEPAASFTAIPATTPEMAAAKQAIGNKCIMCHSRDPNLPFYAKLPLAGTIMRHHVQEGSTMINLQTLLDGTNPQPWAYERIRYVVENDKMPIGSYLFLHWNGKLTAQEKADILAWTEQVQPEETE